MSSQTARRMASPKRATFNKHSPRPILKRPSPLNLTADSSPFASTITIVVSPAISSPHVHFPASPILTAVFSTHSPNSYDRSATKVVPNPVEFPGWGQRVYSPGEGAFSSVKSPSVNVPIMFVEAPAFAAPVEKEDKASKAVRFGSRSTGARDLGKALSVYPRSPYPSAPTSPMSRDKENTENSGVARAKSLDSPKSKRAAKRPASLNVPVGRPAAPRVSSPLVNNFLSPVAESPSTVTIASTRLSQQFWQSVSLEDADGEHHQLSILETHEEGSTPVSAVPRFIFGTKDGLLWSPGLPPKEPSSVAEVRSPADRAAFEFEKLDGSIVTSPGDQLPTYPSIATVLAMDAATITYPPPVVNKESL
ncbi:hypothetical protein DFH07DRAFT_218544 [Mycena maculata]|uniref:Uncharacterized protein n=1 Tax=Mycena maculata TaxID=230809 RepID=A0AAD7HV84_9AGAR|nr:hypothetical protein DFH07DRAFT_218544 [Mycena maculata]